jgi:pyruvate dehydrogenase E2 component (dihydrolipoamide acetyltransferase)
MTEFLMPALGADMEAGTLVAWRCKPGDRLKRGDIIAEVETDKGIIEIEVYAPGVVQRFLVERGQKVPVGAPMAVLEGAETQPATSPTTPPVAAQHAAAEPTAPVSPSPTLAPPVRARDTPRASPSARQRARELGLELTGLQGTGPHHAITLADVERAAASSNAARQAPSTDVPPQAPTSPESSPHTAPDRSRALRRAIATSMARAKREIPHYYLSTTVDLGTASTWLSARNAERSVRERLLMGVLFLKAVALAAKQMPAFNARWSGDEAQPCADVHLGVAIALRGGGLIAPAIHRADGMDLASLMAALQDLVARARTGALRSSELSDGTITVTSLGERGVETVFPIIYPPQTAIVGFGRVVERPWVVAGALAVRPVVTVTLAADHRVTDGHFGARFLASIENLLQEPDKL